MSFGLATVKAVISGDTIVLLGSATAGGPPPEKQVTLAGMMAPRLGRATGSAEAMRDEPFAFASREFLRHKCLGKQVRFRCEPKNPSINREFAWVFLGEENLSHVVVANGWAKTRQRKDPDADLETMARLEGEAEAEGLGLWTKDEGAAALSVRNIVSSGYNALELFEQLRGKKLDGIVEYVRDGSTMRVLLPPGSPDQPYISIMLYLSGLQAPSWKRKEIPAEERQDAPAPAPVPQNDGDDDDDDDGAAAAAAAAAVALGKQQPAVQMIPDPFAPEARFFTEVRLMQRDVKVLIEGVDKYQNFFGSILHPNGNISEELLKNGYARVVDWSIKYTPTAERLRACEKMAKQNKLRLWKNWVAPPTSLDSMKVREFVGKVVEINSPDTITIQDVNNPDFEKRVSLSSVRAPRLGYARRGEPDQPYAWEIREFLRSRLIGKKVRVVMDYVRQPMQQQQQQGAAAATPAPAASNQEPRVFASVLLQDNSNIATAIVSRGWATVVKHRGDEERSSHYDELLAAEHKAQKDFKGLHNTKKQHPQHHTNDVSYESGKAKALFPHLERVGRVEAVLEFIVNAARVKVSVPSQNAVFMLSLSGVKAPQLGRQGAADEPFAKEAAQFVRTRFLQRNVEIEVEAVDRGGCMIGSLFFQDQNVAVLLAEEGLVLPNDMNLDRSYYTAEISAALESAKSKRINVWTTYKEPVKEPEDNGANRERKYVRVSVTEVYSGARFFVHVLPMEGDPAAAAAAVEDRIREHTMPVESPVGFAPKVGTLVCGRFTEDDQYYRAKILQITSDGQYRVQYVDYGNSETLPKSRICPIQPRGATLPAQAKEAAFAYLKVPSLENDDDFAVESAQATADHLLGQTLVACVEETLEGGKLALTVFDAEEASITDKMLVLGLARVQKRREPYLKPLLQKLATSQEYAKARRTNIWQHGDVDSDEEEAPRAWGPRK